MHSRSTSTTAASPPRCKASHHVASQFVIVCRAVFRLLQISPRTQGVVRRLEEQRIWSTATLVITSSSAQRRAMLRRLCYHGVGFKLFVRFLEPSSRPGYQTDLFDLHLRQPNTLRLRPRRPCRLQKSTFLVSFVSVSAQTHIFYHRDVLINSNGSEISRDDGSWEADDRQGKCTMKTVRVFGRSGLGESSGAGFRRRDRSVHSRSKFRMYR